MESDIDRILSDLQDLMMTLVVHGEELKKEPLKSKWTTKLDRFREGFEGLDGEQKKLLDGRYRLWYSAVLQDEIPPHLKDMRVDEWYK